MEIVHEQWRAVTGRFAGWPYEVSNLGNVRRQKRNKLKSLYAFNGYLKVKLKHRGVEKKPLVHRLIAEAFIENHLGKPYVNHIDCDTKNNASTNLEWCTAKENVSHAMKFGGMRGGRPKLSESQVQRIFRLKHSGVSTSHLARRYGVSDSAIQSIANGTTWSRLMLLENH